MRRRHDFGGARFGFDVLPRTKLRTCEVWTLFIRFPHGKEEEEIEGEVKEASKEGRAFALLLKKAEEHARRVDCVEILLVR